MTELSKNAQLPQCDKTAVSGIPSIVYSNEFRSRHGFADFENKTFKITNKKDESTVDCELLKVPTYSFKNSYVEFGLTPQNFTILRN